MIALDLTPTEEAQIFTAARQTGLAPVEYVKKLVKVHLPPAQIASVGAMDDLLPAAPHDFNAQASARSTFLAVRQT